MDILKIGSIIKAKRRERELTQEELANMLGVTKAAVSKWETAESYPDITMLPQIAQLFHISMDELFDYSLEYKPLKIVCKYYFGLSLDSIEDRSILDHGIVDDCQLVKNGRLIGDDVIDSWEVRLRLTSTEENFLYLLQKCLKPNVLVDGYSVRLADGKIIDDGKPNKHYVCKEKIWEYNTTDRKYLRQMLKEQVSMGLIEPEDI